MKRLPINDSDGIILGIDPGLATTGWGVVRRRGVEASLIAFGVILSPAREALPLRLRRIRAELAVLIETHQPMVVAIEQLFFAKFATSIAATAQARGVILLTAAEANVPIVEYNPRSVKIALTGFGSASKIQMQSMVRHHFKLKELPRPDDAADALAIALCHVQTRDFSNVIPAKAGIQHSSLQPYGSPITTSGMTKKEGRV